MCDSFEVVSWYYEPEENLFRDQDGFIVYDIFRVISPGRLLQLKRVRGVEYIEKRQEGIMYELVFPWEDIDFEYDHKNSILGGMYSE